MPSEPTPFADYVAVDPACRYKGHKHSHCDCPWWRRWLFKVRQRPYTAPLRGTHVLPVVVLPEGYEPPSAAVMNRPWPGYCQACQAPLSPPELTWCPTCGASDDDE